MAHDDPDLTISSAQGVSQSVGSAPFTVSDLICQYLQEIGCEYIFGVPGGSLEPFYNALARSHRRGGPRAVVSRHESGAAFMAGGYARETGRLGVCCATTGPGATNLLTGVACAFLEHSPVLALTAQTALTNFGRGAVQESSCTAIDTLAIFAPCTRYNVFVSHVAQLERQLAAAITTALCFPGGPVHVTVPLDILNHPSPVPVPTYSLKSLLAPSRLVDEARIAEFVQRVLKARTTAVLIGDHVHDSIGEILRFAESIDAVILTTPHGRGFVDTFHGRFRGVFGLAGHQSASAALAAADCDLVIAIGTALDEQATGGWDERLLLNKKLIHVDGKWEHFHRSLAAQFHLFGDLKTTFSLVNRMLHDRGIGGPAMARPAPYMPESSRIASVREKLSRQVEMLPYELDEPDQAVADGSPVKPQALMTALSSIFPPQTCFFADIGNSFLWAIHYLQPRVFLSEASEPWFGGALRLGMGFASMGWVIGAAIGTALANRSRPVVCITGDGSVLMNGQELTCAVAEKLPVIYVILNDSAYGTVKHGQRFSGAESIAHQLPPVAFDQLARSMGAQGIRISTLRELFALDVPSLCRREGPTVLDVRIDGEQMPPFAARLKVLDESAQRFLTGHLRPGNLS